MLINFEITDSLLSNKPFGYPAHKGDAGIDLYACIDRESMMVYRGERFTVPFGFKTEIPVGYWGLIAPRSSTGKAGLVLQNTIGVIDSRYRGEGVGLFVYKGERPMIIKRGDRIAQMILTPCLEVEPCFVEHVGKSERGERGFGSTGR